MDLNELIYAVDPIEKFVLMISKKNVLTNAVLFTRILLYVKSAAVTFFAQISQCNVASSGCVTLETPCSPVLFCCKIPHASDLR